MMFGLNMKLEPCKKCGGMPIVYQHMIGPYEENFLIKCESCGLELDYTTEKCSPVITEAPKIIWRYHLYENKTVADVWNGGIYTTIEEVNK